MRAQRGEDEKRQFCTRRNYQYFHTSYFCEATQRPISCKAFFGAVPISSPVTEANNDRIQKSVPLHLNSAAVSAIISLRRYFCGSFTLPGLRAAKDNCQYSKFLNTSLPLCKRN